MNEIGKLVLHDRKCKMSTVPKAFSVIMRFSLSASLEGEDIQPVSSNTLKRNLLKCSEISVPSLPEFSCPRHSFASSISQKQIFCYCFLFLSQEEKEKLTPTNAFLHLHVLGAFKVISALIAFYCVLIVNHLGDIEEDSRKGILIKEYHKAVMSLSDKRDMKYNDVSATESDNGPESGRVQKLLFGVS